MEDGERRGRLGRVEAGQVGGIAPGGEEECVLKVGRRGVIDRQREILK